MPLLSVRSLHRSFAAGQVSVPVLKGISFGVDEGECVAIMGPSGSGKSTLMNLIGLLDRPTSGSVVIDGMDAARLSEDDRSRMRGQLIGFVFQSYNLLPRSTALDNVGLPLVYAGVRGHERQFRARMALESVGLHDKGHNYPSQLSGGEQQRVAIARALVADPAILLADEPTGALDSRTGDEILSLFLSLNRDGQTVVMITHDPGVAARCARTIRLRDGQVVADTARVPARAPAEAVA